MSATHPTSALRKESVPICLRRNSSRGSNGLTAQAAAVATGVSLTELTNAAMTTLAIA